MARSAGPHTHRPRLLPGHTLSDIDWSDDLAVARLARALDVEDVARRERLTAPDALATAAAWYGRAGIAVFPLQVGAKNPATKHGLKDATADADQIAAWWADMPQANIGIRTGLRFDVLDVDPPDGWASLGKLRGSGIVTGTIGYALTPRGGAHLYVPVTGRGNRAGFLPGLDWRGDGGYVVAPPSVCPTGRWQWVPEAHLQVS